LGLKGLVVIVVVVTNKCFVFGNIVDWWRFYAGRAIELQRFARRIVGLCASSSGCERNWSTFDFVSNFSVCVLSFCS
jgi:hypothetical protein